MYTNYQNLGTDVKIKVQKVQKGEPFGCVIVLSFVRECPTNKCLSKYSNLKIFNMKLTLKKKVLIYNNTLQYLYKIVCFGYLSFKVAQTFKTSFFTTSIYYYYSYALHKTWYRFLFVYIQM